MKMYDLPTPNEIEKMHEPKMLFLIYKAIFCCLKVLLDIEKNITKKKIKKSVIKNKGKVLFKGVVPSSITEW